MQQFFRNVFYTDFPAQGAFTGIILFLFGSQIYGSLLTVSGKIHGFIFYPLAGFLPLTLVLLFLLPFLLLLYCIYTNCRFLFKRGGIQYIFNHPLSAAGNLFCFALAVYGLYHGMENARLADMLLSCHYDGRMPLWKIMLPEKYCAAAVWGGMFFLFLWLGSTARIYAAADEITLKKMFGKTVLTILGTWLVVHIFAISLAQLSYKELQNKMTDLQKAFGRNIDHEHFCKYYYNGQKPDPEFWKKAETHQKLFSGGDMMFYTAADQIEPDSKTAAVWRKKLFSDPDFSELETMFSIPLPPRELNIRKGHILSDYTLAPWHRRFALLEYWKIRFAISERNTEMIIDSLEKMRHCRNSFENELILAGAMNMLAVETYRQNALARLISADLLSDGQLLRQKTESIKFRRTLKKIRENILYGETVQAFDWLHPTYSSVRKFRFLTPAVTHLWNKNLIHIANTVLAVQENREYSVPHDSTGILANMLFFSADHFDLRLKHISSTALALEKMIDLHLFKRKTGKYPEYPDTLPIDPFTGKEMIYYKGELPLKKIFVKNNSQKEEATVSAQVVAIFSCGKNGSDDTGTFPNDDVGIYIPLSR